MSPAPPKHVISMDVKAFVALLTGLLGLGVGGTSLAHREAPSPVSCPPALISTLEKLEATTAQLTIQVAVFAEKQDAMGKRLDKLEAARP